MLSKYKKSNSKGFTIIEVMIVLAIAGLILLIVFLAVPSLQRNSRNTQRKNDAAAIAAALSTYIGNSNGVLPSAIQDTSSSGINICNAACATATVKETAKLGYYLGANVALATATNASNAYTASNATSASSTGGTVDKEGVVIQLKASCDDGTQGKYNYSARTAAVFYVTESANGNGSIQCVEQ